MFQNQQFIRVLMAVTAALIIGGTLLYSSYLANQLAQKERRSVEIWGQAVQVYGSGGDLEQFVSSIFLDTSLVIPRVLSDPNGNPADSKDIPSIAKLSPKEKEAILRKEVLKMKSIEIDYVKGQSTKIYYGESPVLRQLRWFPYIQLSIAILFIAVLFLAFTIAKRNEQNRIWVGLAKETAHQLGTPVSSLMAWIEYFKMKTEDSPDDQEMVEEMERDILRLQNIAERFSKIGSKPELHPIRLTELLEKSAVYMRKRMSHSVVLDVQNEIPEDMQLPLNSQLFEWVIENLLKNALDAMEGKKGHIAVHAQAKGDECIIDISDTGKGIPSNQFKKVFEPGFTTKKRGWGLGLSLSKRIIENYHHGKIFVKESEQGKGTTFRIVLRK